MSRSFSITLILLGSAILASLIWLHFYLMGRQHAELFAQADTIHQEVIAQKIQTLRVQHIVVQEFLSDPIYERRRPALHIFATAEKKLEEYLSTLERLEKKRDNDLTPDSPLAAYADYAVQEVVNTAKQTFSGHHEAFDLSEERMKEMLDDFDDMAQLQTSYATTASVLGRSAADDLNRDLITISVHARMTNILEKSQQYSCYRGCWYGVFNYYPVVVDGYKNPSVGEIVNTRIGVGTFTNALNPDNVVIVANGDTLQVCEDGLADFSFQPRKRGEHQLPIKCIVTNPLTGEVQAGEGRVTFQVN
jgi:hypothetical protein